MNTEQELEQLRGEIRQMRAQLNELETRLGDLSHPPGDRVATETSGPAKQAPAEPQVETGDTVSDQAPPLPPPILATPPPLSAPLESAPDKPTRLPRESFEVRFGADWLPRIGIAVLLIGMVFLVTWSYQYLGRGGKVALSYLCCAALGVLGAWLEKKTAAFARVLQAGALALTYFVTYAAHYVEAFRVIDSPAIGLALLLVVVAGVVVVADRKQSAPLGGLALFLGYLTSVISGVETFTLAANAVLAAAALVFLARNRWVMIPLGAVMATYLVYAWWAWKVSDWRHLDELMLDAGYLASDQFWVRAGFLALYWGLFTVGGLAVRHGKPSSDQADPGAGTTAQPLPRPAPPAFSQPATQQAREPFGTAERNALLTLNNLFLFAWFSLLMHHAYPDLQWRFQFLFAGALLVTSAIAYARLKPDRTVLELLFTQGIAVATLGVINYFQGTTLIAALALESVFLLWLSRVMNLRWISWIGRAAFAVAAWKAWDNLPGWDRAMIWSGWFAAAMGYAAARLSVQPETRPGRFSFSAFYFAVLATVLLLKAGSEQVSRDNLPWVWCLGTVIVGLVGTGLRTREIAWTALLPLALGYFGFLSVRGFDGAWDLAPSLALIIVTLAVGLIVWGRARAAGDADDPATLNLASGYLAPFAAPATLAIVLTTLEHGRAEWLVLIFAAETLLLVSAALSAREPIFAWAGLAVMIAAGLTYLAAADAVFDPPAAAWVNLLAGSVLFIASERRLGSRVGEWMMSGTAARVLRILMVVVITVILAKGVSQLAIAGWLTVGWAVAGFVLMTFGFAAKTRPYRMAGLAVLVLGLLRAFFHDMAMLAVPYRILSFIGLGVILLVLGFLYAQNREKLAKWL